MKNRNDRHVGGIEFKDVRRPIESPVQFLSDLLLSGSHIGEHKSWWRDIEYDLYEMFVDNCKKIRKLVNLYIKQNFLS